MNPHQNTQSALVGDWSRFRVVAKNEGFVTSYAISNKLQKGYKKYIAPQTIEIISIKIESSLQSVKILSLLCYSKKRCMFHVAFFYDV